MREDIQKFKVDYIAQELKLTDKEKAEFTPLYTEYDSEIRKSGEEAFRFERQLKKKKDATDDDYKKLSELQKNRVTASTRSPRNMTRSLKKSFPPSKYTPCTRQRRNFSKK